MARWYAHYQNTTDSNLELITSSNCYQRNGMNATNAGTARTSMINTRATLSASFYGSINVGNRNGETGIVVPSDGYTNNGTTFSGTNLYTNTAAVWPSDPRVRPTSQIVIANSNAVSPADNFSAPTSEYNAARTAVQDYFAAINTGGSPYDRLGINPWRTLASIWHDHALTYMAWDDFTPGVLQSVSSSKISGTGEPIEIRFAWGSYQYANDKNPDTRLRLELAFTEDGNPSNTYVLDTGYTIVPPLTNLWYDWQPNGTNPITPSGTYIFTCRAWLRDPVITTHTVSTNLHTNSFSV